MGCVGREQEGWGRMTSTRVGGKTYAIVEEVKEGVGQIRVGAFNINTHIYLSVAGN